VNFKHYQRKGLSEMISVSEFIANGGDMTKVSIADVDAKLLTTDFQQGFIARNPKNHEDLWYVAKKYFDDNLQPAFDITINLNFGQAIEAAKQGKKVARQGWNGKGMFAYIVPAASYPAQTEVAKAEFGDMVSYREYWALKTAQGDIATWAPSGSDSLSEDWVILD
jgi:hypothetical protein